MGGKKDKKKKAAKDPLKKAALAAKKEAKADKAALKRIQKEKDRQDSLTVGDGDRSRDDNDGGGDKGGGGKGGKKKKSASSAGDDLDSILESYRSRTKELTTAELEPLDEPFPSPPRGNFTWTLCPSNGMFYMFGGEYYDGAENVVFDELLRWDPDGKRTDKGDDNDDDDDDDGDDAKNTSTGRWTRILTPPPHPPPRCAHSAVHHNDCIYVFGGECATADKYHHYRDLWKFDIKANTWEECRSRGGTPPAARSGHRAVAWRRSMIIFGGFHEALRAETRFFNDVHLFDFQTSAWTELKYGKLARLPPPRSACNLAVCTSPTEALIVSGGYSKVRNANAPGASRSEGITHVDCWTLPLKSLANNIGGGASPPSWERIARKGEYPSARAGTSSVTHRNKMLVFGGVVDEEGDHHKMQSVFYDDLFALDMERRRWFAMRLKKTAAGGKRRRRRKGDGAAGDVGSEDANGDAEKTDGEIDSDGEDPEDEEALLAAARNEEAVSSGWDLDQLRHNMFAFIDGEGNVVYERIEEDGDELAAKDEGGNESATAAVTTDVSESDVDATNDHVCTKEEEPPRKQNDTIPSTPTPPKPSSTPVEKIGASSVMKVDERGLPTAVARPTPLPRINCAIVVRNNSLYVYGGMLEVGDREVTLDDCWSIDLNKRDKWNCIWPGQMHRQVWKGVDSDNDSYISSDQGADDGDDDSDDDAAGFEPIAEDDDAAPDDEESKEARKKAKKAAKKAKEKENRKGIRHEIAELKERLGVDDERRTPLAGESVADFYARTTNYWNTIAGEKLAADRPSDSAGGGVGGEFVWSEKEVRREGFGLARVRYEELKPALDRLNELEGAQAEREEKKAAKKKGDKKPKKDRLR